jgi:hypothetical protein
LRIWAQQSYSRRWKIHFKLNEIVQRGYAQRDKHLGTHQSIRRPLITS